MSGSQPISKSMLAQEYGLSSHMLWDLLNNQFLEELVKVGYRKEMKILPPIVVRKFREIYGEPYTNDEK